MSRFPVGPFTTVPTIIPHRGFGRGTVDGLLENTLPAFQEALRRGVTWLEVDVRRSADDRLFVLHHPSVETGDFVTDLRSQHLEELGVLTLDDLLAVLPAGVGVVFDVKTSLEDALRPIDGTTVGLLLPVLRQQRDLRPLLVTSFDPAVLTIVGEQLPGLPRGLLSWLSFPLRKAIPAAAHLGLEVVSAHWKSFAPNDSDPAPRHRDTAYSVDIAHRAGLQVVAWSPAVEVGRRLLAAGVDALIVDDLPGGLDLVRPITSPGTG